jgi:hypothetical protein
LKMHLQRPQILCGPPPAVTSIDRTEIMSSQARLILPWQPDSSWGDEVDEDVVPDPAAANITAGDPLRSTLRGAVTGALGGVVALAVAAASLDRLRLAEHVRVAFGQASLASETPRFVWLCVAMAAASGMLVGAGLGWLMRRLHGRVARIVFAAVLVPSLWIVLDAFVLGRFAPHVAAAARFLPSLLGAIAYGVCMGMVRPMAPKADRQPSWLR